LQGSLSSAPSANQADHAGSIPVGRSRENPSFSTSPPLFTRQPVTGSDSSQHRITAQSRTLRARSAHGGAVGRQHPATDGSRVDAARVQCQLDDDLARHGHVSAPPQADILSDRTALLESRSHDYSAATTHGLQRGLLEGQRTERSLPAGPGSVATAASSLTNLSRDTYSSSNALQAVAWPRPSGKGPLIPRRFDRD